MSNILASIILALPAVALTIAGIELDGWHAGLMAFGAAAYLVLLVLLGVTFARLAGQGGTDVPE